MDEMAGVRASTTPGFTYAIAYWFACMMVASLLPGSRNRYLRCVCNLTLLVIEGAFMVATDGVDQRFFVPCMVFIAFIQFAFFMASCDVSWQKAGYFTVNAFLFGETSASFSWQMLYYAFVHGYLPSTLWIQVFGGAAISGMLTFLVWLFLRRMRRADAEMEITAKEFLIALAIGISAYTLSNLSYITSASPFSSHYASETFIVRTMTDVGGCGLLFAYHAQLISVQARAETQAIEQMLHLQYEQYELSRKTMEVVEEKYHDLKHQIGLLRSEITSEEKLGYLQGLEDEIRAMEAQNKTGNQVLDTLLTARSLQCQHLGITLTVVADGRALDFMEPMDLAALFGNALDNAVESVQKIEDVTRRLIHLSIARQKGFALIRFENCYTGELSYVDGELHTTKKDVKYHGYGLKSMRNISEKYGGSCTVKTREGWFELHILLPIPAQKAQA